MRILRSHLAQRDRTLKVVDTTEDDDHTGEVDAPLPALDETIRSVRLDTHAGTFDAEVGNLRGFHKRLDLRRPGDLVATGADSVITPGG